MTDGAKTNAQQANDETEGQVAASELMAKYAQVAAKTPEVTSPQHTLDNLDEFLAKVAAQTQQRLEMLKELRQEKER